MVRVLLMEADAQASAALARSLSRVAQEVSLALHGDEADGLLRAGGFDLACMNARLPRRSGIELLAAMRARGDTTPVLVLAQQADVAERVRALDAGADDFVAQPVAAEEIEARARALLRRAGGLGQAIRTVGSVSLDVRHNVFYREGRPLALSKRESALLRALFHRAGRAVSRDYLLDHVLGWETSPEAVDSLVYRVRKRIEHCGIGIRTFKGMGYMLDCEEPGAAVTAGGQLQRTG